MGVLLISSHSYKGFTLVEISIVMIIIGLLIGGTFGGIKLVENMQVNRTIQDLKGFESAALQFRDTFNRLPGDISNPAVRLPNCSSSPCSTGGNGNRLIDITTNWDDPLTSTDERFTIWHHLVAADLLSAEIQPTTSLTFGEGQPTAAIGGGMRVTSHTGFFHSTATRRLDRTIMIAGTSDPSAIPYTTAAGATCLKVGSIDRKIDDGLVYDGKFVSWCSATTNWTTDTYDASIPYGMGVYDLQGF